MNRDTGEGDREYPGIHDRVERTGIQDRVEWTGIQEKGIGSTQEYMIWWSGHGSRIRG